jgi:hypothetical protein
MVRQSLRQIELDDGKLLAEALRAQSATPQPYPLTDEDRRALRVSRVERTDRAIEVVVPDAQTDASTPHSSPPAELRESVRVQALLASIGEKIGLSIWIPRNDRGGVLQEWNAKPGTLLDRLPLNYDEATLKTIEQIDVLWLSKRSIVRAFEVEHTTSIYSGLLRMADLVALQPNLRIKLHIVAPEARQEKVFQELRRPVFSLLEGEPLSEICTYISYGSVHKLAALEHLPHVAESIVEEYEESAADA